MVGCVNQSEVEEAFELAGAFSEGNMRARVVLSFEVEEEKVPYVKHAIEECLLKEAACADPVVSVDMGAMVARIHYMRKVCPAITGSSEQGLMSTEQVNLADAARREGVQVNTSPSPPTTTFPDFDNSPVEEYLTASHWRVDGHDRSEIAHSSSSALGIADARRTHLLNQTAAESAPTPTPSQSPFNFSLQAREHDSSSIRSRAGDRGRDFFWRPTVNQTSAAGAQSSGSGRTPLAGGSSPTPGQMTSQRSLIRYSDSNPPQQTPEDSALYSEFMRWKSSILTDSTVLNRAQPSATRARGRGRGRRGRPPKAATLSRAESIQISSDEDVEECLICFEPGSNHKLSCGHWFHLRCVKNVVRTSRMCPYCGAIQ